MHIFFHNLLKIYKIAKKGWQFFACGAHPFAIIDFTWGKNINKEGGGQNNEYQI